MDHTTEWPPKTNDDLRNGTTQMTEHTPGYTGFLPAALTSNDAIDKVKEGTERVDFLKLNLKENQYF